MQHLLTIPLRLFFTGTAFVAIIALLITGYLKTNSDMYGLNSDYIL